MKDVRCIQFGMYIAYLHILLNAQSEHSFFESNEKKAAKSEKEILLSVIWETFPLSVHAAKQNETSVRVFVFERKEAVFRGDLNVSVLTFQTTTTKSIVVAVAAAAAMHKQNKQYSFNTKRASSNNKKSSSFIHLTAPLHPSNIFPALISQ